MSNETRESMEAGSSAPDSWTCISCEHLATGEYCAHCGEKRREEHDFSLRHIFAESVEAFFHLDSRVLLTLRTLIKSPGRLTAEFFLGRRKPWMSPLQTFFVCNLIFFVLQPLTGFEILGPPLRGFQGSDYLHRAAGSMIDRHLAQKHVSREDVRQYEEFSARFDQVSHLQAKTLVLAMVPMLALVLAVIDCMSRRFFAEHLIFALHAYAWWLLWILSILVLLGLVFVGAKLFGHPIASVDPWATLLEFGGFGVWLFFAMHRFYRQGLALTVVKAAFLTGCVYGIFQVYRLMLLFTALHAM